MARHRNQCLQNQRLQSVKEGNAGKKMLERTTKFTGQRYEKGMLWSEPELQLSLGSALLIRATIPKKPEFFFFKKSMYQQSVDTHMEKGFVKYTSAKKALLRKIRICYTIHCSTQ